MMTANKMSNNDDSQFGIYENLKNLPRGDEALLMLRKVASAVKPIMRKRGWKISVLCEFLPPDPRLLGLNINKVEKICVRLRYTPDPSQFLPYEQVVDTVLHELSHIVWGAHDQNFERLWNELRDEHQHLLFKGYTGEGFLGAGRSLGGRPDRIPLNEARRRARAAAEKRRTLSKGSGQRLGGSSVLPGADMRRVIAAAAERRTSGAITAGCASGTRGAGALAAEASRNGFRTRADEDAANEVAIANAMIELMEEEEARKIEEEELFAAGPGGGLSWSKNRGLQLEGTAEGNGEVSEVRPPLPARDTPNRASSAQTVRPGRPVSRLVSEDEARQRKPQGGLSSSSLALHQTPAPAPAPQPQPSPQPDVWACEICTLENPLSFLACDACGVERPAGSIDPGVQRATGVRGERGLGQSGKEFGARARGRGWDEPDQKLGWNCRRCGSFMEKQWWTCSACGLMKAES